MDKWFLQIGKDLIDMDSVRGLESLYLEIIEKTKDKEYSINISHIYQQLLYYASIKEKKGILEFLVGTYFEIFGDIEKIALRQSFFYCKYLIKDRELVGWFDQNVIPLIKAN